MNDATQERLYGLLPAIYRLRDAAEGEPLRALLAVIGDELGLVDDDISRLYDNWFIETCQEWVVPYIGDLLGVQGLYPIQAAGFTQRAYVANTVAYRRRKGTAAVLEQLARDVTGWPCGPTPLRCPTFETQISSDSWVGRSTVRRTPRTYGILTTAAANTISQMLVCSCGAFRPITLMASPRAR